MACYEWAWMRFTRQILSGALLLSLLGSSTRALAQGETVQAQRLQSDCAGLRVELDRVNREIAALKQADRNVRNEYRLREKMADAEALARRLTEAERLLRNQRPSPPAPVMVPAPVATPQDGVVELEAKADLLTDQAHRFTSEADKLARTAEEIRNRQALRRRANNWDRDPFAGFEGSKRSLVVQQQRSNGVAASDPVHSSAVPAATATSGGAAPSGSAADRAATGSGSTNPDFSSTGSTGSGLPILVPGTTSGPPLAAAPSASAAPSSSPSAATPLAPSVASKPGLLPRTLLDPASLADVRQTVAAAGSLSDPDAIDAAVAALRQRARALQDQASAMRARARQAP